MQNRKLFFLQGEADNQISRIGKPIELVPGSLAFALGDPKMLSNGKFIKQSGFLKHVFLTSDLHTQCSQFATDLSLPSLALISKFGRLLSTKMKRLPLRILVYCVEPCVLAFSNAAFLLGSFLVAHYGYSAKNAEATIAKCGLPLVGFRERSRQHHFSLIDSLSAIERATSLGWFSLHTFDSDCYDRIADPLLGAISEISPHMLVLEPNRAHTSDAPACSSSTLRQRQFCENRYLEHGGRLGLNHVRLLQLLGASCIVRADVMAKDDIDVEAADCSSSDLSYIPLIGVTDGGVEAAAHPRFVSGSDFESLAERFLSACAAERRVAVCSSGGDAALPAALLASWLIRRDGFSAGAAIAWLRIVRPGAGVGPHAPALRAMERPSGAPLVSEPEGPASAASAADRLLSAGSALAAGAQDAAERQASDAPFSQASAASEGRACGAPALGGAADSDHPRADDAGLGHLGGRAPRVWHRTWATEERVGWAGAYDPVAGAKMRRKSVPSLSAACVRLYRVPADGDSDGQILSPGPYSLRWPRRSAGTTEGRSKSSRSHVGGEGSDSPRAPAPNPARTAMTPPASARGRRGALLLTGLSSGLAVNAAAAMLAAAVGGGTHVRRRAFLPGRASSRWASATIDPSRGCGGGGGDGRSSGGSSSVGDDSGGGQQTGSTI